MGSKAGNSLMGSIILGVVPLLDWFLVLPHHHVISLWEIYVRHSTQGCLGSGHNEKAVLPGLFRHSNCHQADSSCLFCSVFAERLHKAHLDAMRSWVTQASLVVVKGDRTLPPSGVKCQHCSSPLSHLGAFPMKLGMGRISERLSFKLFHFFPLTSEFL